MKKLKPADPAAFWPWYAAQIAGRPPHIQAVMRSVLRENAPS